MKLREIESLGDLELLSEQWASLADSCGARHYVQPFWCIAWSRHFAHGDVQVLAVESEGQLLAIAPFRRLRRSGLRPEVVTFLGTELGPVMEVLVAPGEERAAGMIWEHLFNQRHWLLDLPLYRLAGTALTVFRRMESPSSQVTLGAVAPTVRMGDSWETYLMSRSGGLRRKLRKAHEIADSEQTPLRAEIGTSVEDVTRLLPDLDRVYDAAEREQPRLHFLAGRLRPFTVEILEEAAKTGRLALAALYAGEHPIACAFGFRSGDALCYSGPRFNPAYNRLSPGHVTLAALIEHAHKVGAAEVDLLWGDTRYKREWSNGSYNTTAISATSSFGLQMLHTVGSSLARSRKIQQAAQVLQINLPGHR